MHFCFFFFQNNDIDHMCPVAWRLLESCHHVTAVYLSDGTRTDGDPRLRLLRAYPAFHETPAWTALGGDAYRPLFKAEGGPRGSSVVRALGFKAGFLEARARKFLRSAEIDCCVFEYGDPTSRNRTEFFRAAKSMGLPVHCLPHGLHMFLNANYNDIVTPAFTTGSRPFAGLSAYDTIVTQSRFHGRQIIELGIDGDRVFVIGSARYCPEWVVRNIAAHPPFVPRHSDEGRVRCVLMMPHLAYRIDQQALADLIVEMAELDWLYVTIKDHPRGTGRLPGAIRQTIADSPSVEFAEDDSVALIAWSDAVINISSSIGLEAIVQDKVLLNPAYLHESTTVIEHTEAATIVNAKQEVLAELHKLRSKSGPAAPPQDASLLIRTVVYGQSEPFDVLGAHERFLVDGWRPTPLGRIDTVTDEVTTIWGSAAE